jgi:hypothetical protein
MARNRYLRRDEFATFLRESGDEVVGITRDIHECPIATHLDRLTRREWHVSPLACVPQVDAESGEDQFDLNHEFTPPRWARDFIYAIDAAFGTHSVEVSGTDALYVLHEAVK